ncbi:MAG: hypothetical protein JSV56_01580 [Methanomassiliicoccales archaeon]|nr:MAG: hypothetical protein JSV56_01580 [Methanomassiliicoccales archaeon]
MSDGVETGLIIAFSIAIIGWCITIIGWYYSAYRERKMALNQWKYNMKAKKYSDFLVTLSNIINNITILEKVREINIRNEDNLMVNYERLSKLVAYTFSEYIYRQHSDIINDIEGFDNLSSKIIEDIAENLYQRCWENHGRLIKDFRTYKEQIDILECDNKVIKKFDEDFDRILNDEAENLSNVDLFDVMVDGKPLSNSKMWQDVANEKYNELKEIIREDLKSTL